MQCCAGYPFTAGGDTAFMVTLTVSLPRRLRLAIVLEVVRVDRAVQVLSLLGAPNTPIVLAEASHLVDIVSGRMHAGLIPGSIVEPAISGEAQVGQTLSAAAGSWSNSPTAFAFQWLRCSAAGSGCLPIESALTTAYVLAAADLGSTIEVSVVATNVVGSSAPVTSAPSAVVVAAAPVPPG